MGGCSSVGLSTPRTYMSVSVPLFLFGSCEPSRHDAPPQGPNVDSGVDESQKPRNCSVDRTLLRTKLLPMRHLSVCHLWELSKVDRSILVIPTRLRLRTEIQTTRYGQKMMQEKQRGPLPRSCTKFAECTWRTKPHSSHPKCNVGSCICLDRQPRRKINPCGLWFFSVRMMSKMD